MENLRAVLRLANVPADRIDVAEQRVRRRLDANQPQAWCAEFQDRAAKLLSLQPLGPDYAQEYAALRILLVRQGIADWFGEHGLVIPDEEIDRTARRSPARPQLPTGFGPLTPRVTPPPAVHIDPASVLGTPELPDPNVATPLSCDAIHGLCVPRDDGNWILECDVLRGHRIQVAAVMDDGTDHAIEVPFVTSGEHKINLGLPAGRTPQTVVVVVLNEDGQEVGRGIINRPKTQ